MREISLRGEKAAGRIAVVDDEDYDLVMQYRWRIWEKNLPGGRISGPYARTTTRRDGRETFVYMHKLITGWPLTDHEDHDGLNNQRSNLRPATSSQNSHNRLPAAGYSSRFKGVTWHRGVRKWQAKIVIGDKHCYLGCFILEEDAAHAYDAAACAAWGDYACLNFGDHQPALHATGRLR